MKKIINTSASEICCKKEESAKIKIKKDMCRSCRLSKWCSVKRDDIEISYDCKTGSVHISFPSWSEHTDSKGKECWILNQLEMLVTAAYDYFDYVSIELRHAIHADPFFLEQFVLLASVCGAHRLQIICPDRDADLFAEDQFIRGLSVLARGMELSFDTDNGNGNGARQPASVNPIKKHTSCNGNC